MATKQTNVSMLRAAVRWLRHLFALPAAAFSYAAGKWKAEATEKQLLVGAAPLSLSPSAVSKLTDAWMRLEAAAADSASAVAEGAAGQGTAAANAPLDWSPEELMLIERIQAETGEANRNNVTRTEAYRTVYFRSPELHWALLAHLVSRNGGYNMTDLHGEWLPRLLNEKQCSDVFHFLERANSMIFQDAYPQLLLYDWSRRLGRSLFHLLPAFGVSIFMRPVWRQFWRERDSAILTTALIVNEQNYIEERVVQNPYFQKNVLGTAFFGLQSLLQLNGVILPYGGKNGIGDEMRLAGLILESFQDIDERIEFGKRLYALLFGVPSVYEGAKYFAAAVKHTGSRSDYAPHLFEPVRSRPPKRLYEEKLQGGKLKPGASRVYSPPLQTAWHDRRVAPPEQGDWFQRACDVAGYFRELPLPGQFEMTNEYGLILNKLELAVLATQRSRDGERR